MSVQIRRVQYYTTSVHDRVGSAYQVLRDLADNRINMLAFSCVPVGPSALQLTLFPDDPRRLEFAAGKMNLALMPPQHAFLVQGDDEIGVLADVHRQLYDEHISVYASTGVTDAGGSFGYVIYVRPEDYERAAGILGC